MHLSFSLLLLLRLFLLLFLFLLLLPPPHQPDDKDAYVDWNSCVFDFASLDQCTDQWWKCLCVFSLSVCLCVWLYARVSAFVEWILLFLSATFSFTFSLSLSLSLSLFLLIELTQLWYQWVRVGQSVRVFVSPFISLSLSNTDWFDCESWLQPAYTQGGMKKEHQHPSIMCRVRADSCILSLHPHKMSVSTFMYSCLLFRVSVCLCVCVCVCVCVCEWVSPRVCMCPKHHEWRGKCRSFPWSSDERQSRGPIAHSYGLLLWIKWPVYAVVYTLLRYCEWMLMVWRSVRESMREREREREKERDIQKERRRRHTEWEWINALVMSWEKVIDSSYAIAMWCYVLLCDFLVLFFFFDFLPLFLSLLPSVLSSYSFLSSIWLLHIYSNSLSLSLSLSLSPFLSFCFNSTEFFLFFPSTSQSQYTFGKDIFTASADPCPKVLFCFFLEPTLCVQITFCPISHSLVIGCVKNSLSGMLLRAEEEFTLYHEHFS